MRKGQTENDLRGGCAIPAGCRRLNAVGVGGSAHGCLKRFALYSMSP
jgi:hypothetical protein